MATQQASAAASDPPALIRYDGALDDERDAALAMGVNEWNAIAIVTSLPAYTGGPAQAQPMHCLCAYLSPVALIVPPSGPRTLPLRAAGAAPGFPGVTDAGREGRWYGLIGAPLSPQRRFHAPSTSGKIAGWRAVSSAGRAADS
jgi:hypothetical protein